ncbi:hypothetical protein [Bradyrhizobium sp. USDA 4350]
METATTASAGVALTAPWWIQTLSPYGQFTVMVLGGLWLTTQIVTKIYTTFFKDQNVS